MSSTAEPLLASQDDARRPLVAVDGLRVEFKTDGGTIVAVDGISFSIDPGETVCLVGESGSGKSVTSLSLMRLVEFGGGRISGGKLKFTPRTGESVDLAKASQDFMRELRGNQIGMIFQEPMTSLNPVFTIERQLVDGLKAHRGLKGADARARALELLRDVRVPEPERRLKQYPHELSGGMRQRVVIAMAMACEPRLLIADEPTTALDVTIQAEILALIDRLKRENHMAVLFVTHDMAVVAQMADRVVVMHRGKIVEEGDVTTIFENPQADYTRMLLAAVPKLGEMRGTIAPAPMRRIGDSFTAGPSVSSSRPEPRRLLEVKNLTTRYPVRGGAFRRVVANVHAVEDVSFSINVGETFSLVGESGCGKSSCGRSILRLVEPRSGEIWLNGREIRGLGPAELREARRDMQTVFQDPFASLNPLRRPRDQVAEPLINFRLASKSEIVDRVAELFDRVDLPRSFLNRYPHELSGGQRQRVAIARAIASHPSLGHSRRGGLCARRLGAGASAEPPRGIAGGPGIVLPLHQSRYCGRRAHIALRWGYVSGASRRSRSSDSGVRRCAPSLHQNVDGRRPGCRSEAETNPRSAERQASCLAHLPARAQTRAFKLRRGDARSFRSSL